MQNKTYILITGGAGFMGSRLADWIIKNHPEYRIIIIDNMLGGYEENLPNDAIFINRDLSTDDISDIFKNFNIEYVFHFAAFAAEGLSPFIRKFNYMNNTVASANIINECIKSNVKRLVYTSSASIYGWGYGHDFLESDTPKPIDPYGVAKYSVEQDIQIAGWQHNLDWCIIRPHNVYGINQNIWDTYRNVLGIWMYKIKQGLPITIYGTGEQIRSFSYVDDSLPCYWRCAMDEKASKQIFNIGALTSTTINEAAHILMNITGYKDIVYLEKRDEVFETHPDGKKSIELLGYKDNTTLEQGLFDMWNWCKDIPDRKSFVFDKYELDKQLYSYWKH